MSQRKVVWVLGSGFSKPLGGPLLNELLSQPRLERLRHSPLFDKRDVRLAIRDAWTRLIDEWQPFQVHFDHKATEAKLRPWANAEEFVEMLELEAHAERGTRAGGYLRAETEGARGAKSMGDIAWLGRRYIAAVMHEFVASSDPTMERWKPYTQWAAELSDSRGRTDEVITFNYDLVVETAAKEAMRGDDGWFSGERLHKLHGSVDEWFTDPTLATTQRVKPDAIMQKLCDESGLPAIGLPGPTKRDHMRKAFDARWCSAMAALRSANAVVFVGYRFPETDAEARHRLLMALGENENADDHLEIHIVLGPERVADVQRLEALLRWKLSDKRVELSGELEPPSQESRTFALRWQPLWAQDFLAVFDRERLFTL